MSRSLKFLLGASTLYLAISAWATIHLTVSQNMTWVYPALVAVLIANVVFVSFRYLKVARRWIGLALIAFLSCEICVTLILVGTTGIHPRLEFATWRPVIVFSRQMLVLAGVWMAYAFWYETFRARTVLSDFN